MPRFIIANDNARQPRYTSMTAAEEAIEYFRITLTAKIRQAFGNELKASERWNIITGETNRIYSILGRVINLSRFDDELLAEKMLNAFNANDSGSKEEVQDSIDHYLQVFERRAAV